MTQMKAGRQALLTRTACVRHEDQKHMNPAFAKDGASSTTRSSSSTTDRDSHPPNQRGVNVDEFLLSSQSTMKTSNIPGSSQAKELDLLDFAMRLVSGDQLTDIDLENIDLSLLWSATLEPPVTKASLSELDLRRIVNDPKLRHDLHFERDVSFRPNYDGERGKEKKALAKEYWTVLALELALQMQKKSARHSVPLLDKLSAKNIPQRLPLMFQTTQDILKTLVRGEDVASVDQVLDVQLLMQQLNRGACDLIGLGEWLGVMLKGSCSPVRDDFVTRVVEQIRQAVVDVDPCALALSIEQLFGILETMKLDVANHQIRNIRPLMIADGVQYEQSYFLSQMKKGMDVSSAAQWFRSSLLKAKKPPKTAISNTPLACLSNTIVELVSDATLPIPVTFQFDRERIIAFRADFYQALTQAAIGSTFVHLLRHLKFAGPCTEQMMGKLQHRINQLEPSFLLTPTASAVHPSPNSYSLILEITRAAYAACSIEALPRTADLAVAWNHMAILLNAKGLDISHDNDERPLNSPLVFADAHTASEANPSNRVTPDLGSVLRGDLETLVQVQVSRIVSGAPLDILTLYDPSRLRSAGSSRLTATRSHEAMRAGSAATSVMPSAIPNVAASLPEGAERSDWSSSEASIYPETEAQALAVLAQRIAHVSVLHWRVWGPILYSRSTDCTQNDLGLGTGGNGMHMATGKHRAGCEMVDDQNCKSIEQEEELNCVGSGPR